MVRFQISLLLGVVVVVGVSLSWADELSVGDGVGEVQLQRL